MGVRLDENVPQRLAELLSAAGHDVDTVPAEGIAGRDDDVVRGSAQQSGRFLVPQDLDLSDMRRHAPGTHHGLLLVRLRKPGAVAHIDRISAIFTTEMVEDWGRCLVVATEHKVRVRRPRD